MVDFKISNTQNFIFRNREFSLFQRKVLTRLSLFAVSRAQIRKVDAISSSLPEQYSISSISTISNTIYWLLHVNTGIKAVFLAFLVVDYFGPVVFLDKIAALDYILCIALVVISGCIWFLRYSFYGKYSILRFISSSHSHASKATQHQLINVIQFLSEILHSTWKVLNSIFWKLGCPEKLQTKVDRLQKFILLSHV